MKKIHTRITFNNGNNCADFNKAWPFNKTEQHLYTRALKIEDFITSKSYNLITNIDENTKARYLVRYDTFGNAENAAKTK